MTGQSPAQRQATAIAALVILAIAFGANFFFNHTPKGAGVKAIPGFYPVVFFIGWGTLVPAWLMGKIALGGGVTPRELGIGADRRDAIALAVALVVGSAIAFVPLIPLLRDPAGQRTLHGLFAGLLVASTAEVLLFLGVLGAGVRAALGRDDWWSKAAIVVVSSAAFGSFHFTYPEPWNTLSTALLLAGIWTMTSLLFVLSRSLLATILFNNVMATVGFVKNGLSLPLPAVYGWLLAVLALTVFIAVFRFARR
jgi:hypothetical protein